MADRDVITIAGDSVTVRRTGLGRYVEAVFLAVWLTFWVVGEAVALALLGSMLAALFGVLRDSGLTRLGRSVLERAPGFEIGFIGVFLFLMLWLALWTFGGVVALYTLLRLVAGSDRLAVAGGVLELRWSAGPLRRTRHFECDRIRRIRVRLYDKAVVADMLSGTITLTDLGTPDERAAVCDWLRRRLGLDAAPPEPAFDPLAAPPGWRASRDETGGIRLARPTHGRAAVAAVMGAVAAIAAYALYLDIARHGSGSLGPAGAFIVLLALAAAWVAWSREEWIATRQRLEYRLRFGPFLKQRTFEDAELHVTSRIDSDGDTRYQLSVRSGRDKRTIESSLYDDAELNDCARWMAAATGFRLVK